MAISAPFAAAPTAARAQTAVATPQQPAPAAAPDATKSDEPRARLDYSDGAFYLRSANDSLVLVPSGSEQIARQAIERRAMTRKLGTVGRLLHATRA